MKIPDYIYYSHIQRLKFESVYVDGMGMMMYNIYKPSLLGYYPLGIYQSGLRMCFGWNKL